jgi:hypothetical protein
MLAVILHSNMSPKDRCYACGQPATSSEHVPPKCIFLELKDAGVDYRKQLITVPSCDVHNSQKSKDDEFLLLALAVYFGNNSAGNDHFFQKVMRAVRRAPIAFQKLIDESFPVAAPAGAGVALAFDRERFDREMEMIVRALYFHYTGSILSLPVTVESPVFLVRQGAELIADSAAAAISQAVRGFIGPGTPSEGANPDIFQYRFRHEPKDDIFAVEMKFYERLLVVGNTIKRPPEPSAQPAVGQDVR